MDLIREYVVGLTMEDEVILKRRTGITELDGDEVAVQKLVAKVLSYGSDK